MTAVLLPPSQEMIVMTGRTTRIISRDRQIDITGYQKLKGYSRYYGSELSIPDTDPGPEL